MFDRNSKVDEIIPNKKMKNKYQAGKSFVEEIVSDLKNKKEEYLNHMEVKVNDIEGKIRKIMQTLKL